MKTDITFDFQIGFFRNQSMTLQILQRSEEIYAPTQFIPGRDASITVSVELPANLKIVVSGRHPQDTEIDQYGHILQDKYIHLAHLVIFGTKIETYKIPQNIMHYKDVNGAFIQPSFFWNRNGEVELAIDDSDPLFWLLRHDEMW